jgi:hypothetical protein
MHPILLAIAALGALTASAPALAYIGPGAGITMLGALWGVVLAVAAAVVAVVWYPLRRMLARRHRPATIEPRR